MVSVPREEEGSRAQLMELGTKTPMVAKVFTGKKAQQEHLMKVEGLPNPTAGRYWAPSVRSKGPGALSLDPDPPGPTSEVDPH